MKNVLLYLEKTRGVKARSRSLQTGEYNANDLYRVFFRQERLDAIVLLLGKHERKKNVRQTS